MSRFRSNSVFRDYSTPYIVIGDEAKFEATRKLADYSGERIHLDVCAPAAVGGKDRACTWVMDIETAQCLALAIANALPTEELKALLADLATSLAARDEHVAALVAGLTAPPNGTCTLAAETGVVEGDANPPTRPEVIVGTHANRLVQEAV